MIRKIIHIDKEKCNGCGLCASACHEGAIGMVDGKAQLLREDYCDGLGDCLPACPTGAITFVQREAAAYDEKAVQENMRKKQEQNIQKCFTTTTDFLMLRFLNPCTQPALWQAQSHCGITTVHFSLREKKSCRSIWSVCMRPAL